MTLDGLFTVLGLVVAFYAILPRSSRLNLRLWFGSLEWGGAVVVLALVNYALLYPVFKSLGATPNLGLHRYGITPSSGAYVILVLAVMALLAGACTASISKRNLGIFRDLCEELLLERREAEVLTLFQRHLTPVLSLCNANSRITRWQRLLRLDAGIRATAESAQGVFAQVVLSEQFVSALSKRRPYLAIPLLEAKRRERFEFLDLYLRALFADPSSVLYQELRDTQNLTASDHRYFISPNSRFLTYFFADATVAKELSVWGPIGEATICELDELARSGSADPYNRAMDRDFQERGRWKSSLFVAVHFFDVMVSEAIHQAVPWHMWLYNFPYFSERIVRNHAASDPLYDPLAEWPTRYCYLLYEMISRLRLWAGTVTILPPESPHVRLRSERTDHENDSIPKSSILALGECLRPVLVSDAMPPRFQDYLLEEAVTLYIALRRCPQAVRHAAVLRNVLRQGGFDHGYRSDDARYRGRVRVGMGNLRVKMHSEDWAFVDELIGALEQRE